MENLLLQYLTGQTKEAKKPVIYPVITIRREHGCHAGEIAAMLSKAINELKSDKKSPAWTWINKEIIESAARELKINPNKVDALMTNSDKNIIENVIMAFSNDYISTYKAKNTISNVVKAQAAKGNIIIVGRGGSAILADHPFALHLKLMAPPEWRIKMTMERDNISLPKAKQKVEQIDFCRNLFVGSYTNNKPDSFFYDLVLNRMTLSSEEIVNTIISLMRCKKMII